MKRRTLLRWTGTAGALAVAGCIGGDSDDGADSTEGQGDGSTPEESPSPSPTEEPTQSDTPTESQETETSKEGTDSDPVAVVETFVTAWQNGDIETFNTLIAESGKLDPVTKGQADQLTENAPEIKEIDGSGRDDDGVSVDLSLLFPEADEAVARRFELTTVDGEWRISDFLPVGREHAPAVEFDIEWEDDTLSITHASGDSVPADELFIRGDGITDTGAWHELSTETEADQSIAAGDTVSVGVGDEYSISLVWDDGEYSVTLHSATGASNTESTAEPSLEEYLSETDNYDGTVEDFTGEDQVTVEVGEFGDDDQMYVFEPAAIRVDQGTEVVWEWADRSAHNVVHEGGVFESELHDEEGATFSHTFEKSGTFLYRCQPHAALEHKGAVVVE